MEWLLSLLAPKGTRFNRVELLTRELPTDWLVALVVAVFAALAIYGLGTRHERRAPRAALIGLRVISTLLVVLVILGPSLELQRATAIPPHVAVVVDASRSMALAADGADAVTRFERARHEARDAVRALEDDFVVDVYALGDALRAQTIDGLDGLPATDRRTDIATALTELGEQDRAGALAGVLLFSDGADTERLLAPEDVSRRIATWPRVPVFPVVSGDSATFRDVALIGLRHDTFGFVRHEMSFDVDLRARGFDGKAVETVLLRDGRPLLTRMVPIDGDDVTIPLSFPFTPTRPGSYLYSVEARVLPGESVVANNLLEVVVTVARDQVRVLMICGRPSWDERFLRHLLKKDPGVDLVSFFILRDPDDLSGVSADELSLIPFPVLELFSTELDRFDVVILQNFDRSPFIGQLHLENLRDFVVRRGGGLLLIGGDLGMAGGGYQGSPIEDILPFRLTLGPVSDEGAFLPQLTSSGETHFITRIEADRRANRGIFEAWPELDGTNLVGSLRPDAVALLSHPSRAVGGAPMPIFAARTVGDGRVLALTVDTSWYWNFRAVGEGGTNRHYVSLWQNAVRWLAHESVAKFIDLELGPGGVEPGESQEIEVRAFESDYTPMQGARLQVSIDPVGRTEAPAIERDGVSDSSGIVALSESMAKEGFYRARAELLDAGGSVVDEAVELFEVRTDRTEVADPAVRTDILRAIASATGGRILSSGAEARDRMPHHEQFTVAERQRIDIWDNATLFGLLLMSLMLEWWLRRRSGLA